MSTTKININTYYPICSVIITFITAIISYIIMHILSFLFLSFLTIWFITFNEKLSNYIINNIPIIIIYTIF